MHFEILVEGRSEVYALETLLPKIIGQFHTWRIHPHNGIGEIPGSPKRKPNPKNKTLLHNLPSKLRGYGDSKNTNLAVIILVDLDKKTDCKSFKQSMVDLLALCNPAPVTLFRIAIEELEAWYLGDKKALKSAYPKAKLGVLNSYTQDSQCNTWEKLSDVINSSGSKKKKTRKRSYKVEWATNIAPHMDVENNESPSFVCFRDGLRNLAEANQ